MTTKQTKTKMEINMKWPIDTQLVLVSGTPENIACVLKGKTSCCSCSFNECEVVGYSMTQEGLAPMQSKIVTRYEVLVQMEDEAYRAFVDEDGYVCGNKRQRVMTALDARKLLLDCLRIPEDE